MIMTRESEIAHAIRAIGISPNVCDSNFECANIVDTAHHIGSALTRIANALEEMNKIKKEQNNDK